MSVFSDDELKCLKEKVNFSNECYLEYGDEFKVREIEALIARLEAAEDIFSDVKNRSMLPQSILDKLQVWRKVRGKAGQ